MRKLAIFSTIALIAAFAFVTPVSAAGVGVSPADIINPHLKPGNSFPQAFTISQSNPEEDLLTTIEFDMPGNMASWFKVDKGTNFVIPKGTNRFNILLTTSVPTDAAFQNYKGYIRIKFTPVNSGSNGGVSVVQGTRIDVNLNVTNQDFAELIIRSLTAGNVTGRSVQVKLIAENNGNIPTAPTSVKMEVADLNQKPLITLEDTELEKLQPGETKDIMAEFSHNLAKGEYFGTVSVFLGEELIRKERIVFTVPETIVEVADISGTTDSTVIVGALLVGFSAGGAMLLFFSKRAKTRQTKSTSTKLANISPAPSVGEKAQHIKLNLASTGNMATLKIRSKLNSAREGGASHSKGYAVAAGVTVLLLVAMVSSFTNPNKQNIGDVRGINTANIATAKFNPNPLMQVVELNPYTVHVSPDSNSAIIYTASENEELKVIDENSNWYQVLVPGGINQTGWIEKNNVKDSD